MDGDRIKFHSERAAAELELARQASHARAARAHLGLYALHSERMQKLAEAAPGNALR
jgi:hypothetical protein